MITPNGRYLGRKPDSPDPSDKRFSAEHPDVVAAPLPPHVDLRPKLPPVYNQGDLGACGPNSADGLMCFLYPQMAKVGFSRLQIYRDVRVIEDTVDDDSGVETRDLFKVLQITGAAPENLWPYNIAKFKDEPPPKVYAAAEKYTIASYSRIVADRSYLACLASGFPAVLGFFCPPELDSNEVARTGVLPIPQTTKTIDGHDTLIVGYDTNFKSNPDFKASGLAPEKVQDIALLIRNSWGHDWGKSGHFWMPLNYASNPSTGGDCWTGRR